MKKFKRIIAAVTITGALFASTIPSALAEEQPQPTELPPLDTGEGFSPFQDANGTRYASAVWFMWINGIAQGVSETKFGVSQPLKRVDAAMIVGNYGIEGLNQNPKKAPFRDLPQRAVRTVSALYDAGIINGKSQTLFGSNDTMKRGEAAILLSRAFEESLTVEPTGEYEDVPARWNDVSPNWELDKSDKFSDVTGRYVKPVHLLLDAGIVQGKTATKFGVHDPLTRGELALMIHRIFEVNKAIPEPAPDPSGELPSSAKGITMSLDKEIYSKSETPKLIITSNNPVNQYFGPEFEIEEMKDGSWHKVPFNEGLAFPGIIYTLKTGEKHQESISFNDGLYESPLRAGQYRVVQSFNNVNDYKLTTTLAAHFTITE
ncbi:S-layer homology domain-containing protein [Domibacillus aminovorans]|uniref:SLH domain-containing protein n=1 Tax=Domibacillus aminovorans TaxID=29332 RepID=A0A177L878_9BACI|nr:S-layer homology domain-containing protein [Domibacillus aminovorans]OAH61969.1 hypothetical protein AWH49_11145 [Domibacillus aminovorans]